MMERISWMEHKTNEEILQMVDEKRSLIGIIRSQQRNWLGHIMRGDSLLRTITICNTIFVPGFQVLYFNCLCLKPMEKRLHSAKNFDFMTTAQKNFVFIVTKQGNLYIVVHAV